MSGECWSGGSVGGVLGGECWSGGKGWSDESVAVRGVLK